MQHLVYGGDGSIPIADIESFLPVSNAYRQLIAFVNGNYQGKHAGSNVQIGEGFEKAGVKPEEFIAGVNALGDDSCFK
jgi:hypothetical protein